MPLAVRTCSTMQLAGGNRPSVELHEHEHQRSGCDCIRRRPQGRRFQNANRLAAGGQRYDGAGAMTLPAVDRRQSPAAQHFRTAGRGAQRPRQDQLLVARQRPRQPRRRRDFTAFSMNTCAALHARGKLRPLAVASQERIASHPDIPTLVEADGPAVEMHPWVALVAVNGTPPAVLAQRQRDIVAALGRAGSPRSHRTGRLRHHAIDAAGAARVHRCRLAARRHLVDDGRQAPL